MRESFLLAGSFVTALVVLIKVKYVLLSRVIVPIYSLTKEYENIGFSITFSFLSISLSPQVSFSAFCYHLFKKFAHMIDMKLYLVI